MRECSQVSPERPGRYAPQASTTSFVKSDVEPMWVTLTKRRSLGVAGAALVIAMIVIAIAVLVIWWVLATGN
jgi:hypothetical protein